MHEPIIADSTTSTKLKVPLALRLPARGRITSEGMGGKTASSAINSAMPG
jgi:hypothetical protein